MKTADMCPQLDQSYYPIFLIVNGLGRNIWPKLAPWKSFLGFFSDWSQRGKISFFADRRVARMRWETKVDRSHVPHGMEKAICKEHQTPWLEIECEPWKCSCHRIQTPPGPVPYIMCLDYTSQQVLLFVWAS